MIKIIEDYFILETKDTAYIFKKDKSGILIHLYYGSKVALDINSLKALENNIEHPIGNNIVLSKDDPLTLECIHQEISTWGKGDIHNPQFLIKDADAFTSNLFTYKSHEVLESYDYKSLPSVKDDLKEGEVLKITLEDKESNIELFAFYTVFEGTNVITRKHVIKNNREDFITLKQAYSLNLDMMNDSYNLKSFHGEWNKEMNEYNQKLSIGKLVMESTIGVSSSRCNPLMYLYKDGCSLDNGECYAFNLIYSGNHQEVFEVDYNNHLRVQMGMNPFTFEFRLNSGDEFEVPEAIMSYSNKGFNKMSIDLQNFVRDHIIEEKFRYFPRKVLNNSWEACYFNFNERKLLKMAKCAKKLGVELFVLDDGWFGERNDDTKGLGDWFENKKKLPHGLKGLSDGMKKIGIDFGIWVEPEMVNENSDLYRKHPEWALRSLNHSHSVGRNQMILDLSNKEVEDYIYESMCYVFSESNCSYVKWDMNRNFSDYYSETLPKELMGELYHRYYLGLYSLMKRLKERFPDILFEGCASGGNRFDLGILSYMPQIWASDDTDPFVRQKMQYSYSYGYPMSSLGCHTASSPSTASLRRFTLEDRFSTAIYGAFGYEIDLREETRKSKQIIKKEIEFYKSIRDKLVTSDLYKIKNDEYSCIVQSVSKDKTLSLVTDKAYLYEPIKSYANIPVKGLSDEYNYKVSSERHEIDIKMVGGAINMVSPIHIKDGGLLQAILSKFYKLKEGEFSLVSSGKTLNNAGLNLNENFNGAGINFKERFYLDFSTKFYVIEKVEE